MARTLSAARLLDAQVNMGDAADAVVVRTRASASAEQRSVSSSGPLDTGVGPAPPHTPRLLVFF